MAEKKFSFHVGLNYQVRKRTFSIYREDTFIFPEFSEIEHNSVINYIRGIMQTTKDAYIYCVRVEENGINSDGFKQFDKFNVKMYTSTGRGVVTVRKWFEKDSKYCDIDEHLTIKDFIADLQAEIESQVNGWFWPPTDVITTYIQN